MTLNKQLEKDRKVKLMQFLPKKTQNTFTRRQYLDSNLRGTGDNSSISISLDSNIKESFFSNDDSIFGIDLRALQKRRREKGLSTAVP